jgi:hypothetical protein
MTSKTIYWLPKFDPAAEFVVAAWPRGFTISGYQPKPGEAFDKASIKSPRILEELYLKRWIAVADPDLVTPLPPQPTLDDDADDDELPLGGSGQSQLSRKQRKKLRRAAA